MGLFDFLKKRKPDSKNGEKSKENLQETQLEAAAPTAGERIYYAAWVDSGESDIMKKVGEMPLSTMQISQAFGIPLSSIKAVQKSDWNPPAYGKLTNEELLEASIPKAKDFHEQLKKSFTQYLLKNEYSKKEIEGNYRFVGFNGRGGMFALQVVIEMNKK